MRILKLLSIPDGSYYRPKGYTHAVVDIDEPAASCRLTGFTVDLWPDPHSGGRTFEEFIMEFVDRALEYEMTLLVPDRDCDNQEDFIWCLPVDQAKWMKWYELAAKYKTETPEMHGGIRYINRMEGAHIRTVMMLPTVEQDDEQVLHACAFLRMTKKIDARIYVVRGTDQTMSSAMLMHKVMGTDPKMVEDVEIEEPEEKPDDQP